MRAYLIVRPASAAAPGAASTSDADATVVDLAGIDAAELETLIGQARSAPGGPKVFVRVTSADDPEIEAELAAAMPLRPDAIVLPVAHGRDIAHLGACLAVHEAENGWPDGGTTIVALVTSAAGALALTGLAGTSPRLVGVGWDASAVAAELGARPLDAAGNWGAPLSQVRNLVRFAAAAASVEAIDAAYPGDECGFARHLAAAHRDGFRAVLAADTAQVALIRQT